MELTFTGKITEIRGVRTGETKKGNEWANASFEVTEVKDQYPQCALFDYFKTGEYLDMAKDFKNKFKVGDAVTVHFNLNKNEYQKDGETKAFYKTSAWKIDKVSNDVPAPYDPNKDPNSPKMQEQEDDYDNLPF